jgi:hypothetical protein
MPLQLPIGFGNATLIWSQTGDPDRYTSDFGFTDASADAAPLVASAIYSAWTTTISPAANIATGYFFEGVDVRMHRDFGIVEGSDLTRLTGTYTAQFPPQNVAMLVRKSTGFAGRKNRGRMFLPPCYVAETPISNTGQIDAVTLATLNGQLAQFIDALADADCPMALLHTNIADPPTPVVSLRMESIVATQRRRLR